MQRYFSKLKWPRWPHLHPHKQSALTVITHFLCCSIHVPLNLVWSTWAESLKVNSWFLHLWMCKTVQVSTLIILQLLCSYDLETRIYTVLLPLLINFSVSCVCSTLWTVDKRACTVHLCNKTFLGCMQMIAEGSQGCLWTGVDDDIYVTQALCTQVETMNWPTTCLSSNTKQMFILTGCSRKAVKQKCSLLCPLIQET